MSMKSNEMPDYLKDSPSLDREVIIKDKARSDVQHVDLTRFTPTQGMTGEVPMKAVVLQSRGHI